MDTADFTARPRPRWRPMPPGAIAVFATVAALWMVLLPFGGADATPGELLVSQNPDRSAPAALEGAVVSDSVYVFASLKATANLTQVQFSLEGQPVNVDELWPFDLVGGHETAAEPFDTTTLADGTYTVTATAVNERGKNHSLTATFTVDNDAELTSEPSPTEDDTSEPTSEPSPTEDDTSEPTSEPSPTEDDTSEPTSEPSPTEDDTSEPTSEPSPAEDTSPSTYSVPSSIAADCSVDVTADLNAWISAVPDGTADTPSVLTFGQSACYRIDGTLLVSERNHLTLAGNGSTFRAYTEGDSHRAQWRVYLGSNLAFVDMTVQGVNQSPNYNSLYEWQHNFATQGVQGLTLDNVDGKNAYGDFISIAAGPNNLPPRDYMIRNSTVDLTGRHGLGLVIGERITVVDSRFDNIGYHVVDIEVESSDWSVQDFEFSRNTIGWVRYSVVASIGTTGHAEQIKIADNVMEQVGHTCWAPVWIESRDSDTVPRKRDVQITGNSFLTHGKGVHLARVDYANVDDNVMARPGGPGCNDAGVWSEGSDHGTFRRNDVSGMPVPYYLDADSTDWTICDNKYTSDGTYDQPGSCG